MKRQSPLGRFLIWRVKHIPQKYFLFILSIVVGFISGVAAILLKSLVHYIKRFLTEGVNIGDFDYLYIIYPLIGILLTVLFVRIFIHESIGHGITNILYAISKRNSLLRRHKMFSSFVGSAFTAGFGGSIGLESPVVITGSALGSNVGQFFRLNYRTMTLLIGCGAAGAVAAVFNAPIAALVFALEVLMLDLTMASLIPLLMASVSGAITSQMLGENEILFNFASTDPFEFWDIPFYVLLGIITGFISVYFTKANVFIETSIQKIGNVYVKAIAGGLILGLLLYIFPPLYGEGYESVRLLMAGETDQFISSGPFMLLSDYQWGFLLFLLLVILFKVAATSVTIGSGGVGGIFAPSMFIGGITGYAFVRVSTLLKSPIQLSENNFTLIGMAGLLSGLLHAPLTAIFLIAEITSGYDLIVPLMLTSTISYLTVKYFEPHSLYAQRLAKKGELITHHKDRAVLTLMKLKPVIETDLITINHNATMRDLVKIVTRSKRNIFPVVDAENLLVGLILLDDIREIMFNQDLYDAVQVHQIMNPPPGIVQSTDSMDKVMKKFEETGAWNLPVTDEGKYIGIVSKSKLFSAYRQQLIQFSEE